MIDRYVAPPRDLMIIDSDVSNNDKKYKYGGADHRYCRIVKESKPDFKKLLDEKMSERGDKE